MSFINNAIAILTIAAAGSMTACTGSAMYSRGPNYISAQAEARADNYSGQPRVHASFELDTPDLDREFQIPPTTAYGTDVPMTEDECHQYTVETGCVEMCTAITYGPRGNVIDRTPYQRPCPQSSAPRPRGPGNLPSPRETNEWFRQHEGIELPDGSEAYLALAVVRDGPRSDMYFAAMHDSDDGRLITCQARDIFRTHPIRVTCHVDGGEYGRFDGIVDASGYDALDRTVTLRERIEHPEDHDMTFRDPSDRHEATADQLRMIGELMDHEITDPSELTHE